MPHACMAATSAPADAPATGCPVWAAELAQDLPGAAVIREDHPGGAEPETIRSRDVGSDVDADAHLRPATRRERLAAKGAVRRRAGRGGGAREGRARDTDASISAARAVVPRGDVAKPRTFSFDSTRIVQPLVDVRRRNVGSNF